MTSYKKALGMVLETCKDLDNEEISFSECTNRILAEDVYADRDFPPFNRATKDGIAINFKAIENGVNEYTISGIAAAGLPQKKLLDSSNCIEIMTGAVVPDGADTVIMYEHVEITDKTVALKKTVEKGQNIHRKGSDEPKGAVVLQKGKKISAAEIGVLASVGREKVLVKKHPRICLISTGDELVNVSEVPKAHEIRKSNTYTLRAALLSKGIPSKSVHIKDDKEATKEKLLQVLNKFDVLLLSGGVSKGKYDYLPEVLENIGVEKIFHGIKQRPGKPFWFGQHLKKNVTIFAFPGNPASTFVNYHFYFMQWLNKCLGMQTTQFTVILEEAFKNNTDLTQFIRVNTTIQNGNLRCKLILGNGSGDLTSLSKANGFVLFEPQNEYKKGAIVPFIPTRSIV